MYRKSKDLYKKVYLNTYIILKQLFQMKSLLQLVCSSTFSSNFSSLLFVVRFFPFNGFLHSCPIHFFHLLLLGIPLCFFFRGFAPYSFFLYYFQICEPSQLVFFNFQCLSIFVYYFSHNCFPFSNIQALCY